MANWKKTNFGQLPGDVGIGYKIHMLEERQAQERPNGGFVTEKQVKSFVREHVKKANRRFRHNKPKLED